MEKIDVTLEELRLSVSKSKSFKDCKRKFKFRYIEKILGKDWDHLTLGSIVHRALELFHLHFIKDNDFCGQKSNHAFVMKECYKIAISEFKDKLNKEIKDQCFIFLNNYLKIIAKKFPNVISCEDDFDILFPNNVRLRGFIDRVERDDDGVLHVCDYKSSKSDKYLKNDPFQLLTYAYVLSKKFPDEKTIRGSYIMIRDDYKYLSFTMSKEEIDSVESLFLSHAVDIRSEQEYKPNPTFLCNYCDYIDQCPEGKTQIRNKPVHGTVAW